MVDFPDPDSPTRPSDLAGADVEVDVVDGVHDRPPSAGIVDDETAHGGGHGGKDRGRRLSSTAVAHVDVAQLGHRLEQRPGVLGLRFGEQRGHIGAFDLAHRRATR